jgi:DNA (cytosine-5)-methyltransferase 1
VAAANWTPEPAPAGASRRATFHVRQLTHLDLFSGIGGFALAAQRAGFRTVAFAEVEPYACRVLAERFPGVPNRGDVRQWANFADLAGRISLLTGGYPCQPFSLAGKRGGASDDRHLWPAMRELVARLWPAWVVGENVAGHVAMGLDAVLADLEGLGYAARPFTIPACAVDARHRRDRVWVVAHREDERLGRREQLEEGSEGARTMADAESARSGRLAAGSIGREESDSDGRGAPVSDANDHALWQQSESELGRGGAAIAGIVGEVVADTLRERSEAGLSEPQQREARPTGIALDRDSGRPSGYCRWEPEPDVGRVVDGLSTFMDCVGGIPIATAPAPHPKKSKAGRSHRLRGLGNAIVPQVAEVILKAIADIERAKGGVP